MPKGRLKKIASAIVVNRSSRVASGCALYSGVWRVICLGCFPQLENSPSSVYALEGDDVTIYAGRTAVDPTRIQWEVDSTHSTIKLTGVRMSSKTLPDRMILKNVTASFNLSRYRYTLPSGFNSAWVTLRIGSKLCMKPSHCKIDHLYMFYFSCSWRFFKWPTGGDSCWRRSNTCYLFVNEWTSCSWSLCTAKNPRRNCSTFIRVGRRRWTLCANQLYSRVVWVNSSYCRELLW